MTTALLVVSFGFMAYVLFCTGKPADKSNY